MRVLVARVCLCALVAFGVVALPHRSGAAACAEPGGVGLQFLIDHTPSGGTLCIDSGTYTIRASLDFPAPMTVMGEGATTPVIDCTAAVFCFNGAAGPDDITLQNLILENASKADVQIGSGASDTPVTGWTIDHITATGAGQAGIAINTAADILVNASTITRNGTTPYDPATNPTGDFGLRANRVDSLTVQDSVFSDNPLVTGTDLNTAFSGGAKFDTVTNVLVQRNTFLGNSGGAQLWFDISSMDFHALDNTIQANANAVTGLPTIEAIRAEVSCAGTNGSTIESNDVEGGTLAAVDLFDSNGIVVTGNDIVVPSSAVASYGIRMEGNVHGAQPVDGCDDEGFYPNRDNVASDNDIDLSDTGNALTGVENDPGGISEDNAFVDNRYTARHCYNAQWTWWDGTSQHESDFPTWQSFGQDVGSAAGCTAIVPEIDGTPPFEPTWGPVGTQVTINGSGLQNVTLVKFNGKTATILSTSTSQVVAVVPSGNVTGPVCVAAGSDQRCTTAVFTLAPIVTVTGETPASGRPGDPVVMAGGALTGAVDVTFGGVSAPFTPVSDAEIDAVVPPGALPGPVCVVMPIQGTVCAPDPFTLTAPDAPVMRSLRRFQLAPYEAAWDPAAGADSYDVRWRTAPYGGSFGSWRGPTETSNTNAPLPFSAGSTLCAQVIALNGGGATPGAPVCTAVPVDDHRITHGRGWTHMSGPHLYLGGATTSRTLGATLTLRGVQAKALSLVVESRPGGGTVAVFMNGRFLRRVSTASRSVAVQHLIPLASWTQMRAGTITIRVVSTNEPVVIDGLAVSRI